MTGRGKATLAAAIAAAAAMVIAPKWSGAGPEKKAGQSPGKRARNVIVLQGDGMGTAQRDLIRLVIKGNKPGRELVMNQLDHAGLVHTDPADPEEAVTDSAAPARRPGSSRRPR